MSLARSIGNLRSIEWSRFVGVARDAGILTAQRVLQRLVGLISLYFLVRHLDQADFGQYQFVGVAVAAIAFMALPGLDNALMQSASHGTREFYRRAVCTSAVFSLLGGLLLAAVALTMTWLEPGAVSPLLAAALIFPAYLGVSQWKSLFLAERRLLMLAIVETLTTVATHGSLIAATVIGVQDIWVFALLYLAPAAIVNVALTLFLWLRTAPTPQKESLQSLYRYGLNTSAVTVISMLAEQIERLVIFLLINPVAMAIYLAGDRLAELVRGLFQDVAAVLAPRFARMKTYDAPVARAVWLTCAVSGGIIVVFAFTIAPPILLAIFGSAYAPSIPYAQALLCSVAIGNVGQFQFRFIRSQRDSKSFRSVSLWTSVIRIVCAIGLTVAFGVWGAVATVIIHRLAISVLSSLVIRRLYGVSKVGADEHGATALADAE